jgi:(4-alkanoyl-5-oxo-2,5-dihydrofuran-3-yl)methyl phosphate reductase
MPSFPVPIKPILVFGATGAIGREVVRALLGHGAPVRVLVRDSRKVAALPAHVERIVGDLTDPAAIARSMSGGRQALCPPSVWTHRPR